MSIPVSYMPVNLVEPFQSVVARMTKAKPAIEAAQAKLLADRYDLSNHVVAVGSRRSESQVAATSDVRLIELYDPEEIKAKDLFPRASLRFLT